MKAKQTSQADISTATKTLADWSNSHSRNQSTLTFDFFIVLNNACVAALPKINRSLASFANRSFWSAKDGFGNWQTLVYLSRRCRIMQVFTIDSKNQISFWTYVSSVLLQPFESSCDKIEIASFSSNGQQALGVSWHWISRRVARPLTRISIHVRFENPSN